MPRRRNRKAEERPHVLEHGLDYQLQHGALSRKLSSSLLSTTCCNIGADKAREDAANSSSVTMGTARKLPTACKRGMIQVCVCFAVATTLQILVQPANGCIHDSLEHKVTDGEQQYPDDHPLLEHQRRRERQLVGIEEAVNYQDYGRVAGQKVASSVYQPIRITPYYDTATLASLSEDKRALIYRMISDAINRFQQTLQVVPVQGKLSAQRSCKLQWLTTPRVCKTFVQVETCLEMPIPKEHFGATRYCDTCTSAGCETGQCSYSEAYGVDDSDFLLYVRSATTDYCAGRTLAYASSCQKDQFDRPTFGMTNFCPGQLSTAPEDYEAQVATAMHELTHALGFSANFFPYMRFADGTPRTPRDELGRPPTYTSGTCPNGTPIKYFVEPDVNTVQYSTERDHVVAKLVTPNVAEFVQKHFNCSSLTGAELESQDESGCLGSHWEERLFEPEYMTPVDSFRNVFSALTLAFFEDSGWYRANASAAQRLHFGEQRGCPFATDKCINPKTAKPLAADHYCTSNSQESCSVDAMSRSVCTVSNGRDIPAVYQYFPGDPTLGGEDFADFCPMNVGYTYGDCSNPDNLVVPGNTNINILGESYCPTCRCAATSLRSDDSTKWVVSNRRQTGCYSMRCIPDATESDADNTIEISFPRSKTGDTVQLNCTHKGQQLTVPGFSGSLTCPDPFVICSSDRSSYDFGSSSDAGSGSSNLRSSSAAGSTRQEMVWLSWSLQLVAIAWLLPNHH